MPDGFAGPGLYLTRDRFYNTHQWLRYDEHGVAYDAEDRPVWQPGMNGPGTGITIVSKVSEG